MTSDHLAPIEDYLPILPTDHVRGRVDGALTLFEFGDYECPACKTAYLDVLDLEKAFADHFRFVFRHYPYARIHPHAELAAQAAEAAAAQGKFWEMHELLFNDQSRLKIHDLLGRAESLDLDVKRFEYELKEEFYLDQVRADFRSGVQNGVFGTPGIFVNGVRVNGATDFAGLRSALDEARAAQNGSHFELG